MSAEIVTLTNTLDQSQREKDAALAEVEALAAKSAEAANAQSDEIARMSAEIITLTNTLDQSERAKNAALVDVKALSEDVKKLKEQCARAKASLTELKKSKSSIEKKLIVTRESVSWRVTTPLRIGFRVVKKLLGSRPDR